MSIAVIITDRNTDVLCQTLTVQLPDVFIHTLPGLEMVVSINKPLNK